MILPGEGREAAEKWEIFSMKMWGEQLSTGGKREKSAEKNASSFRDIRIGISRVKMINQGKKVAKNGKNREFYKMIGDCLQNANNFRETLACCENG